MTRPIKFLGLDIRGTIIEMDFSKMTNNGNVPSCINGGEQTAKLLKQIQDAGVKLILTTGDNKGDYEPVVQYFANKPMSDDNSPLYTTRERGSISLKFDAVCNWEAIKTSATLQDTPWRPEQFAAAPYPAEAKKLAETYNGEPVFQLANGTKITIDRSADEHEEIQIIDNDGDSRKSSKATTMYHAAMKKAALLLKDEETKADDASLPHGVFFDDASSVCAVATALGYETVRVKSSEDLITGLQNVLAQVTTNAATARTSNPGLFRTEPHSNVKTPLLSTPDESSDNESETNSSTPASVPCCGRCSMM